jgi:hypothetical protein
MNGVLIKLYDGLVDIKQTKISAAIVAQVQEPGGLKQ